MGSTGGRRRGIEADDEEGRKRGNWREKFVSARCLSQTYKQRKAAQK